jgi:LmbE family N-acetylglucosaminyl deacetylase
VCDTCRTITTTTRTAVIAAVVIAASASPFTRTLPQDRGASGTWQKIQKLQTIASAMHTTAHPDDEHGGVLAWLSRGVGARMSLLTLNRGESGDNAIGSELFDGVGLIRTEELRDAGRYYGLDHQYFTTVVDYGFSKRLDEALAKWGKETVLRDVVAIIRMDRPLVLIARFQGNQRDGHGNHQAAGLVTQDAFKTAGDPNMFPEQIAQGLRPWQPLKLYMGGVRPEEDWTIRVDAGQYSPWLGDSYNNFSRIGLSFQRSQNSGRLTLTPGPVYGYYRRLASNVRAPDKETSFFDGIDTRISAMFTVLKRPAPASAPPLLSAIEQEVSAAVDAFKLTDPSASVPALARGLQATRTAIEQLAAEPDAVYLLKVKEQQFQDAINTALGVELTAIAQLARASEPATELGPFALPPELGPVVPGQTFEVRTSLVNRGSTEMTAPSVSLLSQQWSIRAADKPSTSTLANNQTLSTRFTVTVPESAALSRPYFSRTGIASTRYDISDPKQLYRPAAEPAVSAVARYTLAGVAVEVREPVTRREANLPYGYELRELMVVPAIAVNVAPLQGIVPLASANKSVAVSVELLNNKEQGAAGELRLEVPAGWTVTPRSETFKFARAGERASYRFTVAVPGIDSRDYTIRAIAMVDGKSFSDGYDTIQHRDLETRYLYKNVATQLRGIDVRVVPNLSVGYVMGIGDEVPAAIAQLGARVHLLSENDLAAANLQQFDAIMIGTRAYAVREDLKTYNQRLLDYVKNGGNLIVLYNTPEFVPDKYAPYPGELTVRAEEVSEEDSPVQILQPAHPVFNAPNKITRGDFDGWVEQRGSKFWSAWDKAYTPMIETYDQGQEPQKGGWLWARYGRGHYTYFAYAFHRQLPYAVPGAYRLLANVLSLSKIDQQLPGDRRIGGFARLKAK